MDKRKIDWTFENLCIVAVYIVIIYGVLHYFLINRPLHLYYRIKYGKLSKDYIKKFGDDYTFYKQYNRTHNGFYSFFPHKHRGEC